jgi:hypothetical protein
MLARVAGRSCAAEKEWDARRSVGHLTDLRHMARTSSGKCEAGLAVCVTLENSLLGRSRFIPVLKGGERTRCEMEVTHNIVSSDLHRITHGRKDLGEI